MTVTSVTSVTSDAEYEAAVQRLRAFAAQLGKADQLADQGSLERAADMALVYEAKRWMNDLPEPKQSTKPGAFQTVPDSKNRFATKWSKQHTGIGAAYAGRLLNAAALHLAIGEMEIEVGEGTIRPMAKLISQGRTQEARSIWRRAIKLADGKVPTAEHVRSAMTDHNKAMGYTPAKQTEMRATTQRDTYRSRVKRDFEWLVNHSTPDEVKELLRELAERVKAEKNWARGAAA